MRTVRIQRELRIALAASAAIFLALLAWLHHGSPAIGPDSLYLEGLSRTFWAHPYWVWLKRDFADAGEIVHREFAVRPLYPILLRLLSAIGVTSWKRSSWIAAASLALTLPAWTWALPGKRASAGSRTGAGAAGPSALLAATLATALLLLQAGSQVWQEISSGGLYPLCILLSILVYGFYRRSQFLQAGLLGGIAFLVQSDMELLMLVLALLHLARRPFERTTGRELGLILVGFALVITPWSIGSLIAGNTFGHLWLSDLSPVYLQGLGAKRAWFPDTDSGQGHFGMWQQPWILWDQFVRNRWVDLSASVAGSFLAELTLMCVVLFAGFLDFARGGARRLPAGFALLAGITWAAAMAGWINTFEPRHFLVVNAAISAWLALLIADRSRAARAIGLAAAALVLIGNAGALGEALSAPDARVFAPDARAEALAADLRSLVSPGQSAMLLPGEAEAAALFADSVPLVVLPANHAENGIMDQFIDRFGVRWTTAGETIRTTLRQHELAPAAGRSGYPLWEIRPLPGSPAASAAPAASRTR